LANLSLLQGAPVLIYPVANPTHKSAIKVSSVSPDLKINVYIIPMRSHNPETIVLRKQDCFNGFS